MKKLHILLISIFLFLCLNESHGFINHRCEWWKHHLKNVNQEKNNIIKENKYDKQIIGLIDNEIERAKEILQVFDTKEKNDGSLIYQKKSYTKNEIGQVISEIVSPMFSLHYLEYLVKNIGEKKSYNIARDLVRKSVNNQITHFFGHGDEEFLEAIIDEKIDKNDWKYLTMEILLGSMIRERDRLYFTALSEIEKNIYEQLSRLGKSLTPRELRDIVQFNTEKYLNKFDVSDSLEFSTDALQDSWCWNEINNRIIRDFNYFQKIQFMIKESHDDIPLMKVRYYYHNPSKLDGLIFGSLSRQNLNNRSLNITNNEDTTFDESMYVMSIPKEPDVPGLLRKIDKIRRACLLRITGKEDAQYSSRLDKNINKITAKYLGKTEESYFREEERLRLELEKLGSKNADNSLIDKDDAVKSIWSAFLFDNKTEEQKLILANEEQFNEAKSIFEDNQKFVSAYKQKTANFLKWFSGTKKIDGNALFDEYKNRFSRNDNYLDFIRSTVSDCNGLSAVESPSTQKRFSISVSRTKNVFKVIGYSLNFNRTSKAHLNNQQINNLKNMKSESLDAIKVARSDIIEFYYAMMRKFRDRRKGLKNAEKHLQKIIAEFEVELIYKKISEYISAYENLNYNNEAFETYSQKYSDLQKNLNSDNISDSLKYVIKMQSIFPLIKNFNCDRVKHEYQTKRYLKIELLRDIARLKTLSNLYNRKGVKIGNQPLSSEIREIRLKLNRSTAVNVAGWKMNEINFEKIDKNAVKKLTFIRNRNIWKNDADRKSNIEHGNPVNLKRLKLSLVIPDGWVEQNPDSVELRKGIIKSFKSIDSKSTIYIASIDLNGKNKDEITDLWIKKMGRTRIKARWGKKDNKSYLWTLSNSKDRGVMEVYTLFRGNHVLFVSGISTRDKYNYFKGKINSVFNSISPSI